MNPPDALAAWGLHSPALFALAVLLLNATPGADWLCVLSRTLAGGARSGLAAAAGISLGCVGHALAAAFGLAALLAVSPWAFWAVKLAGAVWLAWLAWGMLRAAARPGAGGRPPEQTRDGGSGGAARPELAAAFRQGLFTNLLNPKVALFFLAFLPQFILASAPSQTLAFLLLGLWFVLQSTVFLGLMVAVVAGLRQRWRGRPAAAGFGRVLNALGGVLFLGLALRLALAETGVRT